MTLAGSQFCPNLRLHARFMYLFHLSVFLFELPIRNELFASLKKVCGLEGGAQVRVSKCHRPSPHGFWYLQLVVFKYLAKGTHAQGFFLPLVATSRKVQFFPFSIYPCGSPFPRMLSSTAKFVAFFSSPILASGWMQRMCLLAAQRL